MYHIYDPKAGILFPAIVTVAEDNCGCILFLSLNHQTSTMIVRKTRSGWLQEGGEQGGEALTVTVRSKKSRFIAGTGTRYDPMMKYSNSTMIVLDS